MKNLVLLVAVFLLAFTSCNSPALSTPASTFTQTPRPVAVLNQSATLYSGPGNINYENLAELPAGTTVPAVGIFGDFVKVTFNDSGIERSGFLWKNALQAVPLGLTEIDILDVPWEPMYLPSCAPGIYDPDDSSVTFSPGEQNSFTAQSAVWNLEVPIRIQIGSLAINSDSQGAISVLGTPFGEENPSIYWQGATFLSILVFDGNYVLEVRDGTSEIPAAMIDLQQSSSQPIQIVFDQPEGKSFSVLDASNRMLKQVDLTTLSGVDLPNGLFPKRHFYFRVYVSGQGSLVVSGLNIGLEPDGKWVELGESSPGLASIANEKNIAIGALFDRSLMIDRRYCQTTQRDLNVVVPDITPGSYFWEGPGQYHFEDVDKIVEDAQQRHWRVFGSHLVWGASEAYPDWLRNGEYTRDDYVAFLEQHIKSMVERYKGKIQYWSIANESPERDFYYPKPYVLGKPSTNPGFMDFWYEKIGPEYMEMAFRLAKEADPDAILLLNTSISPSPLYGDSGAILDQMYGTVKKLKQDNVPIDAIGIQMHLLNPLDIQTPPQKEALIEFMNKFGALGVRVYITELDVDLGSTHGTREERYSYQAQIYRDIMDACLESGVCDGLSTWGVADSLSWITGTNPPNNNEPTGDPLMFDRDFNPKPAYFAVRNALMGIASANTVTPTPHPTAQETINACISELAPVVSPTNSIDSESYDNFDNAIYDGSFDHSKWMSQISLPDTIIKQKGGVLVLSNASYQSGPMALSMLANQIISQPTFLEGKLALCPDSATGSIAIGIQSSLDVGSWFASCTIEHRSDLTWENCGDFLWTQQNEHQFQTTRNSITLGTWHTFRIEVNSATMALNYYIDGVLVNSHIPVDAERLNPASFQFTVAAWKPGADFPLVGLVDDVRLGHYQP
jgi:endo-1,4-beta-xylanase